MSVINDKCRLCLSEKELVSVFEDVNVGAKKLNELILLTTGVEVLEKDVVSKQICGNCRKVVIKMSEFRERSISADKYLKGQCVTYLQATEMKIPNTDVTITTRKECCKEKINSVVIKKIKTKSHENASNSDEKQDSDRVSSPNCSDSPKKEENSETSHGNISDTPKKVKVHESISQLFIRHPNLKMRTDVLVLDVDPFVSLELDAVEKFCDKNNLDMKLAVQNAMKSYIVRKRNPLQRKPICNLENSNVNPSTSVQISDDQAKFETSSVSIKAVDDSSKFKVSPICIKLTDDHAKFKVVLKEKTKRKVNDSESEDSITPRQQSKVKRRRLSSSDFVSEPDQSPPTLMDTLRLQPTPTASTPVPKHKCNICQTVHKTASALKSHLRQHFCCKFCKAKFRLVERKTRHEETCLVGHILKTKSYVQLTRIDEDIEIRKKYPVVNNALGNKNDVDDIIVLSDDDEPTVSTNEVSKYSPPILKIISSYTVIEPELVARKINRPEEELKVGPDIEDTNLKPDGRVEKKDPQPQIADTEPPVQYSSTAIVKPDIRIKGDVILNANNMSVSDTELFKELLQKSTLLRDKLSKPSKIPTNDDVGKNGEIKNLYSQLRSYKIPMNIKCGEFAVTFSAPNPTTEKEVNMWNDIKVVQLTNKHMNINVNNLTLKQNKKGINKPVSVNNLNKSSSITHQVINNAAVPQTHRTIRNMFQNSVHISDNNIGQNTSSVQSSVTPPSHVQQTISVTNDGTRISNNTKVVPTIRNLLISNSSNTQPTFIPNVCNNVSYTPQVHISTNSSSLNNSVNFPQNFVQPLNSAAVNNTQIFLRVTKSSIISSNNVQTVFTRPENAVTSNGPPVSLPISSPTAINNIVPNMNATLSVRAIPNQPRANGVVTHSNGQTRCKVLSMPSLNNEQVVLNSIVSKCAAMPDTYRRNIAQQRVPHSMSNNTKRLNTCSIEEIPNPGFQQRIVVSTPENVTGINNGMSGSTKSSAPTVQHSASSTVRSALDNISWNINNSVSVFTKPQVPTESSYNNLTKPLIRVKSISELK